MKHEVFIDGHAKQLNLNQSFTAELLAPGHYSVTLGARSFRVAIDDDGNVWVNGRTYKVEVFDPRDRRTDGSTSGTQGRQQITSPMPGKVVRVLAAAGDTVEAGQGLVVVEAMKMQNEMLSPKAGRVAEVRASVGATVRAGEILVVVE